MVHRIVSGHLKLKRVQLASQSLWNAFAANPCVCHQAQPRTGLDLSAGMATVSVEEHGLATNIKEYVPPG